MIIIGWSIGSKPVFESKQFNPSLNLLFVSEEEGKRPEHR
jgi:hypothetical protein